MKQIIQTILDTDLYKFTMQNAIIKLFPDLEVEYEFFNRNDIDFPEGFDNELRYQVECMEDLKLYNEEKKYLSKNYEFLDSSYIDYLSHYRFDSSQVNISMVDSKLKITIRGLMRNTILWEVPLMAIISELYYKLTLGEEYPKDLSILDIFDYTKASKLNLEGCHFSDFGTRRRFSHDNQYRVVQNLMDSGGYTFKGTSNVHLAYELDLKATGTMAHEFISLHGALYGYRMGNKMAMENWVKVYKGQLGIALTDTYTTDSFLKTFDILEAKLFDGVRHDSGDPFEYVDKIVQFYNSKNINPLHKTIVFSDGLNVDLAIQLKEYCRGKINPEFGIGTFFSNDLKELGIKPLNMVIKLTKVKIGNYWIGCVKLSDNIGKHTGTNLDIGMCKATLGISNINYDRTPAGNE